jgi:hypothetical protein
VEAFNKLAKARKEADEKIQRQVNQSREYNAMRKLQKIGAREWDMGKQEPDWDPARGEKEREQERQRLKELEERR